MKAKLLTLKRGKRCTLLSYLLFMALLSTGNSLAQTIRYVKPVASGTGTGSSWANATNDLQLAISKSAINDQVWVAEGTYVPTRPANDSTTVDPTNRLNAFVLKQQVSIYGGFNGTETVLSQRNYTANITILSGDINGNDTYDGDGFLTGGSADNAAHVVIANGSLGETTFDGFTITGGKTYTVLENQSTIQVNYADVLGEIGGGLYVHTYDNGQTFRNLIIKGNRADYNGGGIYTNNSNSFFTNVIVEANICETDGGGVYINGGSPTLLVCSIDNNNAGSNGAGLYLVNTTTSQVANTYITNNTAGLYGGGIYTVSSNAVAADLLIANNSAQQGGGIYYNSGGTTLLNATVASNMASVSGGGLYMSSAQLDLKNSIVWGNTAPVSPVGDASNGSINLYYSTLDLASLPPQGQSALGIANVEGNNNIDPQLLPANNFTLSPTSPAIDTGNSTYFDVGQNPDASSITTDLNGNARIVGTVDRGPYEMEAPCGAATVWDGAAWSNGAPVDDTFSAYINGNYTSGTDGEITACSLAVYSGDVVVSAGDNFTISNEVQVNGGTFTIENNANLVQLNDVSNTGNISVVKNSSDLQYLDYTLWSSPTGGSQTLKQFSPNTLDARFYVYNTSLDAYSNYTSASGIMGNPNSTAFVTAKGYLIRMPDGLPNTGASVFTGTFTGVPNNGDITIALATTGSGYNAVGNPYPSPINLQEFIAENSASLDDGTLYFWRKTNDPAASSYSTATSTLFVANGTDASSGEAYFSSNPASSWVINSGQGFFVKAAATATQLNFTNSMRRANNTGQFFKQAVPADENMVSALWLNLTNATGSFAQTAIGYSIDGTNGLDYGMDGILLGDGANAIYTIAEATPLIIQTKASFTAADIVPLAFQVGTAGSYTITLGHVTGVLEPSTLDIFLTDTANGNITSLKNGSYTFTADAGTFDDRFTITYADTALGLNNPQANENGIAVFKKEGSLNITSTGVNLKSVDIFDLQGRRVFSQTDINNTQNVISRPLPQQQVLIVKVTTQDNTVTDRKIIN